MELKSWPYRSDGAMLLLMLLFAVFHVSMTKADLKSGLAKVMQWRLQTLSQWQIDQQQRFEEEVLKTQVYTFKLVHTLLIHASFAFLLVTAYRAWTCPSFQPLGDPWQFFGYALHSLVQVGIVRVETRAHVRFLKALSVIASACWLWQIASETDLEKLDLMQFKYTAHLMTCSIVFVDLTLTLPFNLAWFGVMSCKLSGFSEDVFKSFAILLAANALLAGLSICAVCVMQNYIATKLDSEDAFSFHKGFQRVLRGACDGGVVLDHRTCHIVEDSTSLEQLLNAGRSLVDTNFLGLLLDTESRQSFTQFLHESGSRDAAAVPLGFKLCLQGADGPVSVDVFCTTCVAAGHPYYLLALKEEPNQFRAPPEAHLPDALDPPIAPFPGSATEKPPLLPSERSKHSAHSEVLSACKDLVQVAMLVNSESPMLDIAEVTFSFLRGKRSDGMPSVSQFMKANDWERLHNVLTSLSSTDEPSLKFPNPLLLRIPGRSKGYLRASSVTVSLAEEEEAGQRPSYYWMHLSCFNVKASGQEQDLESISEEL